MSDDVDIYPLPRLDDLVDRLGRTRFISTIDLAKGDWQVALTPDPKLPSPPRQVTASIGYSPSASMGTYNVPKPNGHLAAPHQEFIVAYLDEVIIHLSTCTTSKSS